ncbi:MAG: hypothetical protein HN521_19870 [Candidatus Latescibacteria bacterium]|jgi:hypothetical protein|nr:hypothetical protein [Candidatus Latescibacterota bacterium]MBT5831373.1 hypothetical protein [Candidatus Latescibacterota bacterium]
MKTATMESQIDTLMTTALQSNLSSDQAVECVNQILSVFKDVGHPFHKDVSSIDPSNFEESLMLS